ncbi:MAG TPA: hypothetical protein VHN37_15200 [Actinomycetota bacterium]|nr:hypothetical protein [Actinomycetota bacterium]
MKDLDLQGPVQPGMATDPMVPPPGLWGLVFALVHLAIGFVALRLAFDDGFAAGRATFAAGAWKTVLGVAGVAVALLAVRALVRVAGGQPIPLTPALRRRTRVFGVVFGVLGAWLFACANVEAVARETVSFDSWTSPFFAAGGIFLVLLGLSFQLNVTRTLRKAAVAEGRGVPGIATIAGVTELATSTDAGPVVELDLRIDVNGRVYEATERTVMDEKAAALLVPGATLDVLVDYVDPQVFRLDWKSWQAPAT